MLQQGRQPYRRTCRETCQSLVSCHFVFECAFLEQRLRNVECLYVLSHVASEGTDAEVTTTQPTAETFSYWFGHADPKKATRLDRVQSPVMNTTYRPPVSLLSFKTIKAKVSESRQEAKGQARLDRGLIKFLSARHTNTTPYYYLTRKRAASPVSQHGQWPGTTTLLLGFRLGLVEVPLVQPTCSPPPAKKKKIKKLRKRNR